MNEGLNFFEFNGKQIRSFQDENYNPLFVAKDVCDILEIKNVPQAMQALDDDEKLVYTLHISGQNRDTNVVNESGLYSLALRSNKPQAKPFKKWITSDVLPSIRKHGAYMTTSTIDKIISDPENGIKLLQALQQERLANELLQKEHDIKSEQLLLANETITKQAPKVKYVDEVLQSESLIKTDAIAMDLGMTARKLNKKLIEMGIQYKQGGLYSLTAKYRDKGYSKTKTHPFTDEYGNHRTRLHTYWTELGKAFIIHQFNKQLIKI